MMRNVLKDEKGAVLILVLIVLVASIIMGVMIIRNSSMETRIAGNERRYLTQFADLESAVNLILVENTQSVLSVSNAIGSSFTTVGGAAVGPGSSMQAGTSVTVTLLNIGPPQVGSGNSTILTTRYYTIQASDTADNQQLTVGAYKVFPQGQPVEIP
jgi:hypothetical protein